MIATKEVTIAQYQEFLKENPRIARLEAERNIATSPDQTCPVSNVTWYEAAAFCNWLSRKENLSECYEPNPSGQYAEGMRMRPDALNGNGYRLPTEAEWEYSCRAGAETSRYYGLDDGLLSRYAWYLGYSEDHAQPVGILKPNDLGLFDMLGNVCEWCEDPYEKDRPGMTRAVIDELNKLTNVYGNAGRVLRGGSFVDKSEEILVGEPELELAVGT